MWVVFQYSRVHAAALTAFGLIGRNPVVVISTMRQSDDRI
jgi:hypothetical protein